jgi:hypothetical protein
MSGTFVTLPNNFNYIITKALTKEKSVLHYFCTEDQQPSAGVQVVLAPDGARRAQPSYFRQAVTDSRGRFALENIPPGDYKLFAWHEIERGAYLDPAFLQQFEDRGKAVSLKEGASLNLQLDAIPAE